MSSRTRPAIHLLGTGGTIAGSAAEADDRHYRAGVLSVATLTAAVPGLTERVDLRTEEVFSFDSVDLTLGHRVHLARRIQEIVDGPDRPDGIVVTHGTDSMEESAYAVHLLVRTDVPIVFTGAMRPADDPGADGPANLADAVTVASSPEVRGLGALVVFGGQVFGARDVTKRAAGRLDGFEALHGPIGHVVGTRVVLGARPTRAFGDASAVRLADLPDELPRVEVLVSHPEMSPQIVRAVVDSGADGLVHAGPGAGNVPARIAPLLDDARSAGLVVMRASRVGAGPVGRNGAVADDAHDWVCAGDLPPYKARLLLTLLLTLTRDPVELQRLVDAH